MIESFFLLQKLFFRSDLLTLLKVNHLHFFSFNLLNQSALHKVQQPDQPLRSICEPILPMLLLLEKSRPTFQFLQVGALTAKKTALAEEVRQQEEELKLAREEKENVSQTVECLRGKRSALLRKVELLERRLQQLEADLKRAVVASADDEKVAPSRQVATHAARKPPRTPRVRGQPEQTEEERHSKDSNVAGSQVRSEGCSWDNHC